MFLEDIIDKIREKVKEDKASITIKLLLLLGVILGCFIDDRLGGDFTGWWFFTFAILALIWIVIEFVYK